MLSAWWNVNAAGFPVSWLTEEDIRTGALTQVTVVVAPRLTWLRPELRTALEAFVAGGGTSTMPWTYEGCLKTLWNKTLRWPGHFAEWRAYMNAGLLETEPVEVGGVKVSPREVLHTLLDPKLRAKPGEPDLVIVRVQAVGKKDGRPAHAIVELIDRYDEATGFTAMQRTTGWDGSIKAILNARGVTPRGVHPAETAVPGPLYAAELRKRGFNLTETFKDRGDVIE